MNSPTSVCPVTKFAASENKNTVASAISLTYPHRPNGTAFRDAARCSDLVNRSMPSEFSIGPGAMTLDVIPRGPNSIAVALESESMPALATET